MAQGLVTRVARHAPGGIVWLIAILIASTGSLAAQTAAAAEVRSDQLMLYLGRDFTGPSKTWSLKPDQPFLAVPYTGDDFRPVSASLKLGTDVGVLLFEQPFFSTTDETCDYRLGRPDHPQLWWLSEKVISVPEGPRQGQVESNLPQQEIASLILYRRASGPPPGALLLERRRYVNWDCEAPTKARGYKRLFVPIAAPPHREGCFNLATALSYGASGTVALDFSAASELLLLEPRDLDAVYDQIDHGLTVVLHDHPDCAGAAASFSYPPAGGRRFELKQFGFDRKARSLTLRYDRGPYDPMLLSAGQTPREPPQTDAEAPAKTAGEESRAEAAASAAAPAAPASAAETAEPTGPSADEATAPAGGGADETAGQASAGASPEPAVLKASEEPQTAEVPAGETTGEAANEATAQAPENGGAPDLEPAAAASVPSTALEPSGGASAATPEASGDSGAAASLGELAPAGETRTEIDGPEAGDSEGAAPTAEMPEAEAPSLEAPALETPPAETPKSESPPAETTAGVLILPEVAPEATDKRETFKFPLLQGYRLSACLYQQEDCGEPAASQWCKARGFAGGAASFEIDENIGSLFPTLALGDLQLCANFVCDGFKEITCQP